MLKKYFYIIAMIFLLTSYLAPTNTHAEVTPTFQLIAANSVEKDHTWTVEIKGTNVSNLFAYEIILGYNKEFLRVDEVKSHISGTEYKSLKPGEIQYGIVSEKNAQEKSGNLLLTTIKFTALKTGNAEILLKTVKILNKDMSKNDEFAVNGKKNFTVVPAIVVTENSNSTEDNAAEKPVEIKDVESTIVVENGVSVLKVKVKEDTLIKALQQGKGNTLVVKVEKPTNAAKAEVSLPLTVFKNAVKENKKAVIQVETLEGSYSLPVSEIDVTKLAKDLGTTDDQVQINVQLYKTTDSSGVITKNRLTPSSNVVEFKVEAVSKNKKLEINHFSQYIERTIVGDKPFHAATMTGVRLNDDGTFTTVPTFFIGNKAIIKSKTNSKYMIVQNKEVSFKDVSSSHWAKDYINTLSSKYIIAGTTKDTYSPKEYTTRAQFTVLLARALALTTTNEYKGKFSDVKGTEWYNNNNELAAAIETGIIAGKTDGTFAPNEEITRAQAAAMIRRAMDYVSYDATKLNSSKTIGQYKDLSAIKNYDRNNVETILQAGIIEGNEKQQFNPNGFTSRDQMAKILSEFLSFVELAN